MSSLITTSLAASSSSLTVSGLPSAPATLASAPLNLSTASSPFAARALSKLPKGRETECGVMTPGRSSQTLRSVPRLKLFPPTELRSHLSGLSTQASCPVGRLSSSSGMAACPPARGAHSSASGTSWRTRDPAIASWLTLTAVPSDRASRVASHFPGSEQEARSTPWLLALIAMWLRMSTVDPVRMASTPPGMSSRPPSSFEKITLGGLPSSLPCTSARLTTVILPLTSPPAGRLITSHSDPPMTALIACRSRSMTLERANKGWPRTTSSPKLVK
mmetsp:Transcript_5631/g.16974  ORF Transcript_5631/g.16974 Transcript_5631/m.16974 type:complete len:275 (+) Transcript_5631:752-1576(+)